MPKSSRPHTQRSSFPKAARKAAILQQVLYSDPFSTRYSDIPQLAPQRPIRENGRLELSSKQGEPLIQTGCALRIFTNVQTPQLEVKIAVLRQYVREHDLDVKDGRGHRSFWKGVDRFYDEKIEELGRSFDSLGWRRYLRATIELDERLAPPPAAQYIEPLFTYTPFVMKICCILN
ncbi:hypothetical protein DFH06DRAFT_1464918 [Mycena polygramma]|nr:hypothetical protein DFH06DRAFT_1464918 [Mycena polygramma]